MPERVERTEGEFRVQIRQAGERLEAAEKILRTKETKYEKALDERDERFSKDSMKHEATKAAEGLNFSNLDELRSLKFAPPPIAQLVARCVSTLIAGDDIGGAEAYEAVEAQLSARSSPRGPMSARAKQDAACERLTSGRGGGSPRRVSEGAHSPVPMSARGERPLSAREQQRPASARGERPASARGESPVSARGQSPLSAHCFAEAAKVRVRLIPQ